MKIMLPSGPGKITQIKKEIQKLAMAHNIPMSVCVLLFC